MAALAIAGGGCDKSGSSGASSSQPAEPTITWQRSDLIVNKTKHVLEYGRYDRPVPLKVVPLAQARRDTPLAAWTSWQSHMMQGKTDADLAPYFDHFTDGAEGLARIRESIRQKKATAEGFFKDASHVDDRPAVIGMVKYAGFTIVVYSNGGRGPWRGACMVLRGGKWTIDETSKLTDPVLQKLVGTNFEAFRQATSRPR
ncbi:MAG: hypothetical protein ACE15C_03625 [Phycisphaerae bacterium]